MWFVLCILLWRPGSEDVNVCRDLARRNPALPGLSCMQNCFIVKIYFVMKIHTDQEDKVQVWLHKFWEGEYCFLFPLITQI